MPLNDQRRPSTHVEISRFFRASVDAPGAARRFVGETLDQAGVAEGIDDAKLVVTELATNSIVHARSDFTVSVWMTDREFYVSVHDDSSELPARTTEDKAEGRGRGLAIVALLATGWGTEPTAGGKRVWVRLRPGSGGRVDRGSPRREARGST
jgi:anti-sigma regulatory factor (Ser/Thr protein kinase)